MSEWYRGSEIEERHEDVGTSLTVGNQWGDEGKGKVVDIITQHSGATIRFQGGHNAGHTLTIGDKKFDVHILTSGMVTEGGINLIASGCVLGIDLNKVDLEKFVVTQNGIVCTSSLEDLLKRDDEGDAVRVGMIPELEKLEKGGVDISKSGLKISGETTVIGMHNVLLDAYDEVCRMATEGLQIIGSTGSGISRAYASRDLRFHFTINDLLYQEDLFYASIIALWEGFKHTFPNITANDLINNAKEERNRLCKYINREEIEIIEDEQGFIADLQERGIKIIGEGAQASMIGAGNSFFGTASDPSLRTFLEVTGMTAEKVGNIFLVHKMPPSSVGIRPGYLKIPESDALNKFRNDYREFGVSTGRPRDLFEYPLPETARGASINTRGIDDEGKIVPVYNRVDGIEDASQIHGGEIRVVTGYTREAMQVIGGKQEPIQVGISAIHARKVGSITPKNMLKNYPSKSRQADMFGLGRDSLELALLTGDTERRIEVLLGNFNAAIFDGDEEREFLIGTGPDRDDLELRKGAPIRSVS